MKFKAFTVAALLAAISISAHAGDSKDMKDMKEMAPAPACDAGFYVGIYGGAQFSTDYGNDRRTLSLAGGNLDVPGASTSADWGGVGGIKAGYNFESYPIFDGLRLQPGVEGEALYIGSTSTATSVIPINDNTSYNSAAWFVNGILRFKLDFPLTPYIGAGIGGEYITAHTELVPVAGPGKITGLNSSDVDFAVQLLAGFDYEVVPHWSLFTEYKFIDALGTDLKYSNVAGISGLDYRFKPDQLQQHLIVAGVKYGF